MIATIVSWSSHLRSGRQIEIDEGDRRRALHRGSNELGAVADADVRPRQRLDERVSPAKDQTTPIGRSHSMNSGPSRDARQ
jgi:hypothetical protein